MVKGWITLTNKAIKDNNWRKCLKMLNIELKTLKKDLIKVIKVQKYGKS